MTTQTNDHIVPFGLFERGRAGWTAVISIQYPEGVVRHPSTSDLVKRELGRTCVIDNRYEHGLRVAFGARGESQRDAEEDAQSVGAEVLGLLHLDETDVVEARLNRVVSPAVGDWGRHLHPVAQSK